MKQIKITWRNDWSETQLQLSRTKHQKSSLSKSPIILNLKKISDFILFIKLNKSQLHN